MTEMLHERFARVGRPGEPDWGDVVRRAGRRTRRRRMILAAAAVAVAAVVVPTAVALRGSVDFFTGEPAPKPVVLDFARLDVGAPAGMAPGVIADQTRAVLRKRLNNGRVLTVWAAPTRKGGFCTLSGCHPAYSNRPLDQTVGISGVMPNGVIRDGPVRIFGSVQLPEAAAIELRYESGDSDRERLTWISPPIRAAFFVFDVGREHWNDDQPRELALLDSDGKVLHREQVKFSLLTTPRSRPDGTPSDALLDQARKLISVHSHTGVDAVLWVAPTADGRTCHWLRYGPRGFGGGCPPKQSSPQFGLGNSQGKDVVLLWGGPLPQDIRDVVIRYEDGDRADVKVTEGMVVYDIPAAHFRRGHRPFLLVARDADGREVGRQTMSTKDVGAYPCKTPVPIGAGEKACP